MKTAVACILVLCLTLVASLAFAEAPVREGRVGTAARLAIGTSGTDAAAEIGMTLEYTLWGHLSLGGGWTYVDGANPLQVHATEVFAKGYLFGTPLDIFAAAALQLGVAVPLPVLVTVRAGVEWQSPWLVFIGAEANALFEPAGVGWLFGGSIGLRF